MNKCERKKGWKAILHNITHYPKRHSSDNNYHKPQLSDYFKAN